MSSIIPGDSIASIEEYGTGTNTFDDGDMVRSLAVGTVNIDRKQRLASVNPARTRPLPKAGDVVVGTVAAVMSSMIAVAINYVNSTRTKAGVECICSTRHMRKRTVALPGDVVTLKIQSLNNGTLHAQMDDNELGVLFTKCRKCGGRVLPYRDAIKCTECSWIDDRQLSRNFGQASFLK